MVFEASLQGHLIPKVPPNRAMGRPACEIPGIVQELGEAKQFSPLVPGNCKASVAFPLGHSLESDFPRPGLPDSSKPLHLHNQLQLYE